MKDSLKNEIAGKGQEVKGALKEMAGRVTDNPKLEAEGKLDKLTGKIRGKIGQAEGVLDKLGATKKGFGK